MDSLVPSSLQKPLADNIDHALLDYTYKHSFISILMAWVGACLIAYNISPVVQQKTVIIWFLAFTVVTVSRCLVYGYYRFVGYNNFSKHYGMMRSLFFIGGFLIAACWALVGIIFIPTSDITISINLMVLSGAAAGSIPVMSGFPVLGYFYIIMALLPQAACFWFRGEGFSIIGVITVVFTIFLLVTLKRSSKVLYEAIYLRYKTEDLMQKLQEIAVHDPLTGVYNRRKFDESFNECVHRAQEKKEKLALLYLDVDKFKKVNDKHGHIIGDKLLISLAQRLQIFFKENDLIFRLGGDEFAVLIPDIQDLNEMESIIQRLHKILSEKNKFDSVIVKATASIGGSIYPRDGKDLDALLSKADSTMYQAKNR